MSLQESGPISAADINIQLGKGASSPMTLNDTDARSLAGIPSGTISYYDFYGKPRQALLDFTSNGTWTVPGGVYQIQLLVVGGGGAGGQTTGSDVEGGGGGGGGGVYVNKYFGVVPGQVWTITTGAGGTTSGSNGGSTVFYRNSDGYSVTMLGGGSGGASGSTGSGTTGGNGASGGGGSGVTGNFPGGVGQSGFDGGPGVREVTSGGGGGAGAFPAAGGTPNQSQQNPGVSGSSTTLHNGGAGITALIAGNYYAVGGGGGAGTTRGPQNRGMSSHGGGLGGYPGSNKNAVAYSGGGGGGAWSPQVGSGTGGGGTGGGGRLIIAYGYPIANSGYSPGTILTGVQSAAACYNGQSGFCIDVFSDNDAYLTCGAWPSDPPNCQTASWQWLAQGGVENNSRKSSNATHWKAVARPLNLTSMNVGAATQVYIPHQFLGMYGSVYNVYKSGNKSIQITLIPTGPWGTGDTGTSISVQGWFDTFTQLGGGTVQQTHQEFVNNSNNNDSGYYETVIDVPYSPGTVTLSW